MTIACRCPSCQAIHHVEDVLAGTKARCRCGAILTVPAPAASAAAAIAVSCPACGRQHQAAASLGGTRAKCVCGYVLTIPTAPAPAGSLAALLEECKVTPQSRPRDGSHDGAESPDRPEALDAEAERRRKAGQLFAYAVRQVGAGVKPGALYQDLLRRGLSPDEAEHVVHSVAPDAYVERSRARKEGRKHLVFGGSLFLAGLIITAGSQMLFDGSVVCLAWGPLLFGFFYFLYGLLVVIIGQR